jgi:hypothetical protein
MEDQRDTVIRRGLVVEHRSRDAYARFTQLMRCNVIVARHAWGHSRRAAESEVR